MLVEQLSNDLMIEERYVRAIVNTASHRYRKYSIPKKSGNGTREICHPSRELKLLQRWVASAVLHRLPVHDSVTSYRKRRSIFHNAHMHARSHFLLRMDFSNFFPSITAEDIQQYLAANRESLPNGWSERDDVDLCKIVCRAKALTIGAPTSPALSNAICYDLDRALSTVAVQHSAIYTRYADDLFFSTSRRDVLGQIEALVVQAVDSLSCPSSLRINPEKTLNLGKKQRRTVTGLVLTCDGGVSIGRKQKRYVRHLVHSYDELDPQMRGYLAGYLAHTRAVEPDFVNRLYIKYGTSLMDKVLRGKD